MCMCTMGTDTLVLGTISWMLLSLDVIRQEQLWQIQLHDAILSVCCYDDEDSMATRIFSGLADGTVAVTEVRLLMGSGFMVLLLQHFYALTTKSGEAKNISMNLSIVSVCPSILYIHSYKCKYICLYVCLSILKFCVSDNFKTISPLVNLNILVFMFGFGNELSALEW